MEGNKKREEFTRNCQAVSEVTAIVLMISIVVLCLSSVALTIFSDEGAVDPPHTPHANLQENLERSKNTVRIFNSGGETIDLKDVKIILNVDGQQVEFDESDLGFKMLGPDGNQSDDDVFTLRDCIEIDTSSKVDITNAHSIDLYFVHTESSQVIQKTMLWRDFGNLPDWITPYPYGSVFDSQQDKLLDPQVVDEINDERVTTTDFPKDQYIYENFTFGSLDDLGIPEETTFSKVILKIVYCIHDQSAKLELEVNNGSPAIIFDLPKNNNTDPGKNEFTEQEYDITAGVKNATDLENLVIKISTTPNAAAYKVGWIDYIGIHLDY